jgi:hypothetical protein
MAERIPAMDPAVLIALEHLQRGDSFEDEVLEALAVHGLVDDNRTLSAYALACLRRHGGEFDGRCLHWNRLGGRCALVDGHDDFWHQAETGGHRWGPLAPLQARLYAEPDAEA